jgi:hypothetical protein
MTAIETFDAYFHEMRWRCLSLAADLDRLDRAADGPDKMPDSCKRQLEQLHRGLGVLLEAGPDRAARVQMVFSDRSAPPPRSSSGSLSGSASRSSPR